MKRIFLSFSFCVMLSGATMAGTLAQFRTTFGDIEVELFDQAKPVTVSNFINYVESGSYRDMFVHRLVPGFVIQGGGYTITNRGTTNWAIYSMATNPPIVNEFGIGPTLNNVFGTLAMAKVAGTTNSATSQWFFNLTNNTALDANDVNNLFVVFGKVVRGTNILNLFNRFQTWTNPWPTFPAGTTNVVLHNRYAMPFNDVPLLWPTSSSLSTDTNLLFVDVTLLKVTVNLLTDGAREISWNSATSLTNVLEFTTNFPPVWLTVLSTNGTGNRIAVTNNSTDPKRFYRIRTVY